MELLLNLSWLVISLVAILLLRGDWRRRSGPPLREWIALATFLFLLFPVISLTDDLHPEIALAEAATGKKIFHLLRAHGPDSQPQISYSPGVGAIVSQNRYWPTLAASLAALSTFDSPNIFPAPANVTFGRAPPSILL